MRSAVAAAVVLAAVLLAAGCAGKDEESDGAVSAVPQGGVAAADLASESLASPIGAVSAAGITVVGTDRSRRRPTPPRGRSESRRAPIPRAPRSARIPEAMEHVVAALRDAGISRDDLQTEQVSVWPRTSDDGVSIVGYDASNTVRATIRDLDRAGGIVDAAVAAGANQVYGPSLTVSDAEAHYRAAVDAAFDDARARAEAIAEKAGVTLGAPVAIVEGAGARRSRTTQRQWPRPVLPTSQSSRARRTSGRH